MSPSSSTSTGSQIATWRRSLTWTCREFSFDLQSLLTGKIFVWSPAFLPKPSSARYSSAPSITTVWSNYQTSYNDFCEVYITETVTLSPYIRNGPFDQFNFIQSMSRDQSFFVLIGQIAFSWFALLFQSRDRWPLQCDVYIQSTWVTSRTKIWKLPKSLNLGSFFTSVPKLLTYIQVFKSFRVKVGKGSKFSRKCRKTIVYCEVTVGQYLWLFTCREWPF